MIASLVQGWAKQFQSVCGEDRLDYRRIGRHAGVEPVESSREASQS